MINKRRVRRIKNLIYGFFVLVFFLPAVLVVVMFFRMRSLERNLESKLDAALAGNSTLSIQQIPDYRAGAGQQDREESNPDNGAQESTTEDGQSSQQDIAPDATANDNQQSSGDGEDAALLSTADTATAGSAQDNPSATDEPSQNQDNSSNQHDETTPDTTYAGDDEQYMDLPGDHPMTGGPQQ